MPKIQIYTYRNFWFSFFPKEETLSLWLFVFIKDKFAAFILLRLFLAFFRLLPILYRKHKMSHDVHNVLSIYINSNITFFRMIITGSTTICFFDAIHNMQLHIKHHEDI